MRKAARGTLGRRRGKKKLTVNALVRMIGMMREHTGKFPLSLRPSDELDPVPMVQSEWKCTQCGRRAAVFSSDCCHFGQPGKPKFYRIRVMTWCRRCDKVNSYRLGGKVIVKGKVVLCREEK